MALWLFQMVFNFVMAGVAVAWLLSRRQARRALSASANRANASLIEGVPPVMVPVINTPLASPVSTLSERQAPELRPVGSGSAFDAYEKAEFLLSKGMDLREVARQTGLSLAELQLIGKMSQKNQ